MAVDFVSTIGVMRYPAASSGKCMECAQTRAGSGPDVIVIKAGAVRLVLCPLCASDLLAPLTRRLLEPLQQVLAAPEVKDEPR